MKKEPLALLAALCVLAATLWLLTATKVSVPADDYAQKRQAAALAARCFTAVGERKLEEGIPRSAADINDTGMIGPEYSAITTTLGNLEAKRTATNPNMAAMIVDMFHELGLEPGDKVAVNCSGSFPALNIAVLCAVQVLELDPIVISSFGASTYGANDPEFTYPDMEHALYEAGLLRHKSAYISIGGIADIGGEMAAPVRDAVVARLMQLDYAFLYEEDLLRNVQTRHDLYSDYGEIACFVNVGGNDVSFGDSSVIVHADGGILTELSEKDRSTGLVQLFLAQGVPVIHLLNIKGLAAQYGLPIDPTPQPAVGEGGVYYADSYRKGFAAPGLLAALLVLWRYRSRFCKPDRAIKWWGRVARPAQADREDGKGSIPGGNGGRPPSP